MCSGAKMLYPRTFLGEICIAMNSPSFCTSVVLLAFALLNLNVYSEC